MIRIPEQAIALIKKWEGFSPRPYKCPGGHLTIGYGHLIRPNETFPAEITEEQAEEILMADILRVIISIRRLLKPEVFYILNDNQLSALISFVFNVGSAAFQRSTLRQKLNRFEFADAADEFPRWVYSGGKRLRGLVLRRLEERRLFNA